MQAVYQLPAINIDMTRDTNGNQNISIFQLLTFNHLTAMTAPNSHDKIFLRDQFFNMCCNEPIWLGRANLTKTCKNNRKILCFIVRATWYLPKTGSISDSQSMPDWLVAARSPIWYDPARKGILPLSADFEVWAFLNECPSTTSGWPQSPSEYDPTQRVPLGREGYH